MILKRISPDKIKYLLRSASKLFNKGKCPYCGSGENRIIKRKYLVTRLVECNNCNLLFRVPNDTNNFNEEFYQSAYNEPDGITTQLPDVETLEIFKREKFNTTSKGIDHILPVFKSLIPEVKKIRLIDYGSSWGYMSFLFQQQGIDVQGYEISKPRAKFGIEHLGLDIKTDVSGIRLNNNIFFSSHVIEHVPSIKEMVLIAEKVTSESRPAYFIAYSPNGSFDRMREDPHDYHSNWGMVHPNYVSDKFYKKIFNEYPYYMTSSPYDLDSIASWDKQSQFTGKMNGSELLVIVRLKPEN